MIHIDHTVGHQPVHTDAAERLRERAAQVAPDRADRGGVSVKYAFATIGMP
jgi:hypothetical protein